MSDAKHGSTSEGVIHVYDGIEEQDHRLPSWWLAILWGTLVFGLGYWLYYETAGLGLTPQAELKAELAAIAQKRAAGGGGPMSDATLLGLSQDPAALGAGKAAFQSTCAACHGASGEGTIGPNLTDKFWLHGGKPTDIHRTISQGSVAKGMPAWEQTLGPERVKQLAAYVLTLKGTNAPGGKAPQGEPEP
jgi:cytochrome c oxidase cbb3-type subunit III